MAELNATFCEPCKHSGILVQASLWCNDCAESFCEDCIKSHKFIKILRNHHVINITDRLELSDLNINETCPNHSKPFDSFCPLHDKLLCLTCVQLGDHGKCGDLLRIDDAAKGVKTSTAISYINDSITSILSNVTKNLKQNDTDAMLLCDQKEILNSEIQNFREKINKKLDQLQNKLLNELETKFQNSASQCNTFKNRLKQNEQKINQLKTELNKIKTHASDVQTFIGMKTIEMFVYDEKVKLQANMKKSQRYQLELKINSKLKSVIDELNQFGEIIIEVLDCTQYTESHDQQAQEDVSAPSDIDRLRLEKKLGIRIQAKRYIGRDILDCLILPTQQMVFSDYSKRLLIYTTEGLKYKEVPLSSNPMHMTVVAKDMLAVTYIYKSTQFDVININTNRTEKSISVSKNNHHRCIFYSDGKFYVVVADEGVKIVTLDGNVTNTILTNVNSMGNIQVQNKRLYYTCFGENKVHCCDLTGNQLWSFIEDRIISKFSVLCMTVGVGGNIFVIENDSSVISAISSDGQKGRVLLDKTHGINKPSAIFFEQGNQTPNC